MLVILQVGIATMIIKHHFFAFSLEKKEKEKQMIYRNGKLDLQKKIAKKW